MKKTAIILSMLLLVCVEVKNATALAKPPVTKHKTNKHFGSPVLFWTNNKSYGPIEVFVNNVYKGDITESYQSTPECASQGCVTVIITGENNVWTAQTKDGKRKWASKRVKLEDKECNAECLL